LRAKPDHRHALGALADAALHACNWGATEVLGTQLEMHIGDGRSIIIPFTLLGYHDNLTSSCGAAGPSLPTSLLRCRPFGTARSPGGQSCASLTCRRISSGTRRHS
jgi:hypothetical protein